MLHPPRFAAPLRRRVPVRTAATCTSELARLRTLATAEPRPETRTRLAERAARLEAALPVFIAFERVQRLLPAHRVRAIPANPFHVHRMRVAWLREVADDAQIDC